MKSHSKEQNSLSKSQLQKKATLLKHKILTNASITHNTYEYRIQQLKQQQNQIKAQLNQLLKKLIVQVQSFGKSYKSDIQNIKCLYFGVSDPSRIRKAQSQEEDKTILSSFVCAQKLKQYLNSEKKVLKQLLQNRQQSKNRHQADKLHSLVRTKHLQQVLEKIQLAQLQKQVKYLSTHVINSSGLIYVPEAVMTQAEQQQINKKLQLMISEIQRLVNLQVVCSAAQNKVNHKTQQNLLIALQNQQKRLKRISEILKHEKQNVEIKEKSIQKYFNISNKVPLYRYQNNCRASDYNDNLFKEQKVTPKLQKIQLNQLHQICNELIVEQYRDIVSSQVCQIQELNKNLKFLRNKIIKIE